MPTTRKPTKRDIEMYGRLLRHMLGVLTGDIKHLEHETLGEGAGSREPEEDGGDSYFQELSLELLQRDENTVREIMEALERIDQGTFGKCGGCEKWIQKERLKAVPHALNCIDCQRLKEQEPGS